MKRRSSEYLQYVAKNLPKPRSTRYYQLKISERKEQRRLQKQHHDLISSITNFQ